MLKRKHKLKKKNDFKELFDQGRSYYGDFLKIKTKANNLGFNRFAFVVGLKISKKAVWRNKIKKRLEEIVFDEKEKLKCCFDIVVIPSDKIIEKEYQLIKEELTCLFEKAGLIKK